MSRIWRGYRWAVLADLNLAREDARGVAQCVARVDGAGGEP